jgi:hypothetical protein
MIIKDDRADTGPYYPLGTVPTAYEGMEGRQIKIKSRKIQYKVKYKTQKMQFSIKETSTISLPVK